MTTQKTLSLIHVREHVAAFKAAPYPMSAQWNALKRAAVEAVWTYAVENDLTIAQVTEMTK